MDVRYVLNSYINSVQCNLFCTLHRKKHLRGFRLSHWYKLAVSETPVYTVDVLLAGSSQVDTCAAVMVHDKCDTCYL
jgi:hypothetical protein